MCRHRSKPAWARREACAASLHLAAHVSAARMRKKALQAHASGGEALQLALKEAIADVKKGPEKAKEKGAQMIALLATEHADNGAHAVRLGAIKPLIAAIAGGNDPLQCTVAEALAILARGQPEHQQRMADAVVPLVGVMRGGSSKAMMHAAAALAAISELAEHRELVVKAGAIGPLVRLIRTGIDDSKVFAANTIGWLAEDNPDVQDAVATAGAIPLLITAVHSGKVQTAAAHALSSLLSSGSASIKNDVVAGGGVPPLLSLLNSVGIGAQVEAAAAVGELADGNIEMQDAVSRAGGIGPLLALLPSRNPKAQAKSARALAKLARCAR